MRGRAELGPVSRMRMMVRLVSTKDGFRYDGRPFNKGDEFDATAQDALLLILCYKTDPVACQIRAETAAPHLRKGFDSLFLPIRSEGRIVTTAVEVSFLRQGGDSKPDGMRMGHSSRLL